jgi:hypothetical protein
VRSRYGVVGRVSGVFQDGALAVKYRNSQKHIWQSASDLTRL